ncbi:hypothetical protein GGS21DRAFT_497065 [Xylaria nigripes]|nr:hypothetical protein GGS21DRAFT_497065 [Xylaria nigripes]
MKLPTPIPISILLSLLTTTHAQNTCSFHLRTEGAFSSSVSQFEGGQVRGGVNEAPTAFTLNGHTLTDGQGRACWWTPPSLILQCDVGQSPDANFAIGCDGLLSYQGQTRFQECRTGGDGDPIMIYREPHGSECGEITLQADGCRPSECNGGGGGGGGTVSVLPLQQLTGLPGLIGTLPAGAGTGAPANTATSTLPLQGLTGLPGLIGSIPGGVGASAPPPPPPPANTGAGTLPLQGLTGLPGLVGPIPTNGGGAGGQP